MKNTSQTLPTLSIDQLKAVAGGGFTFGTNGVGVSIGNGPITRQLQLGLDGNIGYRFR